MSQTKQARILDLVDAITYDHGVISNHRAIEDAEAEIAAIGNDFEVITTGIQGWDPANAVIRANGYFYLARLGI